MAEAEARRRDLQHEIGKISAQLSDRHRLDSTGKRITKEEYFSWRRRAQYVLNQLLAELRQIKDWIRTNRPARPLFPALAESVHIIDQLCDLIEQLEQDGVELDPPETTLIRSARAFAARFNPPPSS
jgi:hypothetical protein